MAKTAKTAKPKTAKTKAGAVSETQKVHEIIGRALTDKKFAGTLTRNPRKVAADYKLSKQTADLVHRGVKLRGELHTVAKKLHKGAGLEYQSV
jgi:hypothetical protein